MHEWLRISDDPQILEIVTGYKLRFCETPVQLYEPSNPPYSRPEMVASIQNLLQLGSIVPCTDCEGQFISPIFLTPKSNGTYRFILNLKSLNRFIIQEHFKMEDIRTACKLLSYDSYMATIDLKEAYFLVPVHKSFRKYLRFRFENTLYEFVSLCFGQSSAPYCFTKLMKPVLTYLRTNGHTLVGYLDDIWITGNSFSSCLNSVKTVANILESLGFVINMEKSNFTPTQNCKFLGLQLNSRKMTLELPTEKRIKIYELTKNISSKSTIKIREFAQFVGTLTAACPAVSYGWLYTKQFEREKYLALEKYQSYDAKMRISSSLQEDFKWWERIINYADNAIQLNHFQLEIFSDSSLSGWGAFCNGETVSGFWTQSDMKNHINYLELLAAFMALKCFCKFMTNSEILLRIDNTTAISYINRMGGIQFPHLNKITRDIWQWCEDRKIFIFASYIKSRDNTEADRASRFTNVDTEWELRESCFQEIVEKLGEPEVDLFASCINKKCPRFVSWKRDPDAYEIDAFTLKWDQFFFYAFPPFAIILKSIRKIINDGASGIFVAPYWPSQPWFPLFMSLVDSELIYFGPDKDMLLSPSRTPHPLWPNLTLVCAILSGKRSSNSH